MNKIDQHIKDKLSQPQTPPLDAWKNIQAKLDKKEEKRKAIPLFYWIGSTAACVILGVGIYYSTQNNENTNPKNSIVKQQEKPKNRTVKQEVSNTENSLKNTQEKENNIIYQSTDENALSPLYTRNNSYSSLDNNISKIEDYKDYLNHNSIINQSENLEKNNSNQEDKIIAKENNLNPIQTQKKEEEKLNLIQNEEKSLELVLQEEKKKEDKIELKKSSPKIAVSSYISPAKMIDSKSILSDEFNQNEINNMVTVAYGAKVAVKVNDRLNVRTGISKVDLEQRTSNVSSNIPTAIISLYAASSATSNHQNNIAYNSNMRVSAEPLKNTSMLTATKNENSRLEQKIQYVEVPLEVEYKLMNFNKFNLLATGGGSYYLLTKNSISLTTINNKVNQKIGEATNLNDNSYSLNTGLKLEYNFSNKTSLNLEPNYRYMLNPINNVSEKNPSLLGLNIGFSIKF